MKKTNNDLPLLDDLPVAEKIKVLSEICAYLTDKVCGDLFDFDSKSPLNLRSSVKPRNILNQS